MHHILQHVKELKNFIGPRQKKVTYM